MENDPQELIFNNNNNSKTNNNNNIHPKEGSRQRPKKICVSSEPPQDVHSFTTEGGSVKESASSNGGMQSTEGGEVKAERLSSPEGGAEANSRQSHSPSPSGVTQKSHFSPHSNTFVRGDAPEFRFYTAFVSISLTLR